MAIQFAPHAELRYHVPKIIALVLLPLPLNQNIYVSHKRWTKFFYRTKIIQAVSPNSTLAEKICSPLSRKTARRWKNISELVLL